MPTMSYCRFQNTLEDLRDCQDALDKIDNLSKILSNDEREAAIELLNICQELAARWRSE